MSRSPEPSSPASRRAAGFSLAEAVLASALMGLCSLFLTTLLIVTLRTQAHYSQCSLLVVKAQKALAQVTDLLRETRPGLIQAETSIHGVLFPRAARHAYGALQFNGSGELLWQGWQVVGHDPGSRTLYCSYQALASPSETPESVTSIFGDEWRSWPRQVLLRGVLSLRFKSWGDGLEQVFLEAQDDHQNRYQLQTSVKVENG